MSLSLVYWLCLAGGLGFLLLSLVLSDAFDFIDLDVEVAGSDIDVVPVFFTAVAAFGAGGLLGTEAFGLGRGGSILAGLGTGVGGGFLTGLLFAFLHKQEATHGFELSQLVGRRGRASLPIGPGRVGRVSIQYEGMTRSLVANSSEDIGAGEEVIVQDVVGNNLSVVRPDTLGLAQD